MLYENTGNKITSIKINKNKVVVKFSNSNKLELPHEVFTSFYLFKGKMLVPKEIKEIKEQVNIYELYKYARRLCTSRIYSEHKIREKLYLKEASKKEVDEVISKLKKEKLINDDEFASEYLVYANEHNIGKNKIISKLKEKGVFDTSISKLSFPYKNELNKAYSYIDKLEAKYDKYPYKMKKDKSIQYLISQGFDLDVAMEVCNDLKYPKEKEEINKLKEDYKKVYRQYERKYRGKELKEKIISSLLRKGYRMSDITHLLEEK